MLKKDDLTRRLARGERLLLTLDPDKPAAYSLAGGGKVSDEMALHLIRNGEVIPADPPLLDGIRPQSWVARR